MRIQGDCFERVPGRGKTGGPKRFCLGHANELQTTDPPSHMSPVKFEASSKQGFSMESFNAVRPCFSRDSARWVVEHGTHTHHPLRTLTTHARVRPANHCCPRWMRQGPTGRGIYTATRRRILGGSRFTTLWLASSISGRTNHKPGGGGGDPLVYLGT